MSTTSSHHSSRIVRTVKKLEKPRPLKISNTNRHSTIDTRLGSVEDIMVLADTVAMHLSNGNYDRTLQSNVVSLNTMLKTYGAKLEVIYKDQLDRMFVTFRNGCRDENLDYISRLHLLELIELRATQWGCTDNSAYYKHKFNLTDIDVMSVTSMDSSISNLSIFQASPQIPVSPVMVPPQPLLLSPGELVKSSGKFAAPTKIAGKNYCKDEVVIRNSDSGKVMGIKGRRVHMIEELSETVISFQRVNPGAKERLVQITGPAEDKIIYAKQLMEETIRRNASPVRTEMPDKDRLGSSSSLNSSTSDDSLRYQTTGLVPALGSKRTTLLHSFSTSDATLGEYKYTVTVGDDSLKITGSNLDLVRIAKLVLDEYFSPESTSQLSEFGFDEENEIFEPAGQEANSAVVRVNSQDSEESEVTLTVQQPKTQTPLSKSRSFKTPPRDPVVEVEDPDVFFPNPVPMTPEELKAMEALTVTSRRRGVTRTSCEIASPHASTTSPSKIVSYSFEQIMEIADGPLCRRPPADMTRISKDFPGICKKAPTDWFDPKAFCKKRLEESDALRAIQGVAESGSPDPE